MLGSTKAHSEVHHAVTIFLRNSSSLDQVLPQIRGSTLCWRTKGELTHIPLTNVSISVIAVPPIPLPIGGLITAQHYTALLVGSKALMLRRHVSAEYDKQHNKHKVLILYPLYESIV